MNLNIVIVGAGEVGFNLAKSLSKEDHDITVIDIDPIKKKYPIHEPYIVLCPTNSHVGNINHRGYRSWPEKNWRDLIQRIIDDTSLNILLVGSKDEKEYFNVDRASVIKYKELVQSKTQEMKSILWNTCKIS